MKTIVIGDIHGCYEELIQLLDKANITEDDCVISLGDIVDRGTDSVKVYDFLKNRPNTIVLMGNHERKHLRQTLYYSQEIVKLQFKYCDGTMVPAVSDGTWVPAIGDGAVAPAVSDRYNEFLEWVSHRPYYYETEEAILVHAAVENGIPMQEQKEQVLCGCTAGEKHLNKVYGKTYWSEQYTGSKVVIFGHHMVGDNPLVIPGKIYGIDTGACHGGRLTGLILPDFEIVQVEAARDYWKEEKVKWQLPVMISKPWSSYKWKKIKSICNEFRNSSNSELSTFILQKEQWVQDLIGMAPEAIIKVEEKLAELISIHGADGFKKPARNYSYASLLYKANSSKLNVEFLQQNLQTPEKWLKVMRELGVK